MALALRTGVTAPRIVVRGGTYAVTRRCVCRKAFLGWWHPEVDDVFFWCLALMARKCGVCLHHAVRVGSHYHLTFTLTRPNLGDFLQRLNHQLSCALNKLLEREGHESPRELFDARGTHAMRLMDAEAQLAHIVYERGNVVDAGLAETCDGVPGRTLDMGLWKGAGVALKRPTVHFPPGEEVLRLEAPPLLYRAFGGDLDALVHHERKLEEEAARAIRARRKRRARTPDEVRSIDPWDEPLTPRERRGGRVPSFKTGRVGVAGKEARIRGATEVRSFREMHAAANGRWCEGDRDVSYPHGTYEMRRFHGARVAAPAPDAWVSAPGPTLEEVRAELERKPVRPDEGLVDRVRATVVEAEDRTRGTAGDRAQDAALEDPARGTAEDRAQDAALEDPAQDARADGEAPESEGYEIRPRHAEESRGFIHLRNDVEGTGPPED
jgi:putative transposase